MAAEKTRSRAYSGRLYFDHLPKTAGMAVTEWLLDALGSGCVSLTLTGLHRDLIRQYGGTYSVICAHSSFIPGEALDPRYSYITCFRDPVERVVSWLYYAREELKQSQESPAYTWVEEFLESDGEIVANGLHSSISNLYVNHFSQIGAAGSDEHKSTVDQCFESIATYDVVGFQENLVEYVEGIAALVGVAAPKRVAKANVTTSRPERKKVSAALLRRISDLNSLDVELYERLRQSRSASSSNRLISLPATKISKYDPVPVHRIFGPAVFVGSAECRGGKQFERGQEIIVDVEIYVRSQLPNAVIAMNVFDSQMMRVFGTDNIMLRKAELTVKPGTYTASFFMIANLPAGRYTVGIAIARQTLIGPDFLVWHDAVCDFNLTSPTDESYHGYAYLPSDIAIKATTIATEGLSIAEPKGSVTAIEPFALMAVGERRTVQVEVRNSTDVAWLGDLFRPVRLSYRWLDEQANSTIQDGERSPIPIGGIGPNSTCECVIDIFSPQNPGIYTLLITMIQESVCWFDQSGEGFSGHAFRVEVSGASIASTAS